MRDLCETVGDLTSVDTNVFQLPVVEMTQRDTCRLAFTMRDHGGDPAVDESGEENPDSSPDGRRDRSE
jgi:hypothetical protein